MVVRLGYLSSPIFASRMPGAMFAYSGRDIFFAHPISRVLSQPRAASDVLRELVRSTVPWVLKCKRVRARAP